MNTRAKRVEPLADWSAMLIFCDQDDSDLIDCRIVDISSSGCRLKEINYKPYTGQLVYYIFTSDTGIFTLRAKVVKIFEEVSLLDEDGVQSSHSEIAIHFENASDSVGDFKQSDIDDFMSFIVFHAPGEEEWADDQEANSTEHETEPSSEISSESTTEPTTQ